MRDTHRDVDAAGGRPSDASVARPAGPDNGPIVAGPAARAAVGTTAQGATDGIDIQSEHAYWREHFVACDYVEKGSSFVDYGPAYDFGVNARGRHPTSDFDDVEPELSSEWGTGRGFSRLSWARARPAARDAWHRVTRLSRERP